MRDIARQNNEPVEELTETVRTLARSDERFEKIVGGPAVENLRRRFRFIAEGVRPEVELTKID
jgi:hypothetical protein